MFTFFTKKTDITAYPIKRYFKFEFIKRKYLYDINKTIEYYHNRDRAVTNNHMLTRLIDTITPDIFLNDIEYFKRVDITSRYVARQFDITSNISKGKVHDNIIYGNNSKEIFLYTENDIDIFNIDDTILYQQPLRVIQTSHDVIDFNIPYHDVKFNKLTTTTFELDVRLLLMMYKYWCSIRIKNDMSINSNVFVAKIVLPNALYNLTDLIIFNRYISLANNITPPTTFKSNTPFVLVNYLEGIDKILKTVIKDTKDNPIPLTQLLTTIPTIVNDDMNDVLKIHHNYYTMQSNWVLWYSRISIIYTLLIILGNRGIKRNLDIINILPVKLKEIERRKSHIESILPEELYYEFKQYVLKIKKIVGRR